MIDSRYRNIFQPLFDRLARQLLRVSLSPDQVTWLAFVVGLCAAATIATGRPFIGIALLWLSGLLDVLDGTMARLQNSQSPAGAYLDLILDRLVEAAIIIGFLYWLPENTWAAILFFVAVLFNFSTFMVAGSLFPNKGNKSMYYDPGIMERTETFVTFSLMALFPAWSFAILMIFNTLTLLTGAIRFVGVLRYSKEREK